MFGMWVGEGQIHLAMVWSSTVWGALAVFKYSRTDTTKKNLTGCGPWTISIYCHAACMLRAIKLLLLMNLQILLGSCVCRSFWGALL